MDGVLQASGQSPANLTIPAEPYPMPNVASSDEEDSFDSFEVLSHEPDEVEPESFIVAEKEPESSPALPVSLTDLVDIREMINKELSQIENNSTELQEQNSIASNGALSTNGSTHSQVEHLIQTNEILRQNAASLADAMRNQRDKVVKWQEEVQLCLTNYKNKLIETRIVAANFQTENIQLAEQVDKFRSIKELQDQELLVLKTRLMQLENCENTELVQQIQQMTEEKCLLVAKIDELEIALKENAAVFDCQLNQAREKVDQNVNVVADLKKAIEEKDAEIMKFHAERATMMFDFNDMKRQYDAEYCARQVVEEELRTQTLKYCELTKMLASTEYQREMQKKISDLQSSIFETAERKTQRELAQEETLKNVNMQLQQAKETNKKFRDQAEEDLREITETLIQNELVLEEARMKITKHEETITRMGQELKAERDESYTLRADVERLTKTNTMFEAAYHLSYESKLATANERAEKKYKNEIEQLTCELMKTRAKLDNQSPASHPEDYQHIREQLANAQKKIIDLEEATSHKDGAIELIQKELETAKAQNDQLFAFKSQLELYKSDFELERNLKNNIQEERDQIAEDLQNLHRRNQQLQDELELLREHSDTVVCNRPSAPADSSRTSFHSRAYSCPKCKVEFADYAPLEEHIEMCL